MRFELESKWFYLLVLGLKDIRYVRYKGVRVLMVCYTKPINIYDLCYPKSSNLVVHVPFFHVVELHQFL